MSQQANRPLVQAHRTARTKEIHDNVHGTISLDPVALQIIDTPPFQRLRDIKQLGCCSFVFPGAIHTRFEHSLGTYKLAGDVYEHLSHFQQAELDLTEFDRSALMLAGLCHDLGHGPFSHVFDNEILSKIPALEDWKHEHMSTKMLDYIVETYNVDIPPALLKRVKDLILGTVVLPDEHDNKRFLFDVVANVRNSIDVDKFDYIARDCRNSGVESGYSYERLIMGMKVIDNEICFRQKQCDNLYHLFATRARLYRTVYTHDKVKAVEAMITDALSLADPYLKFTETVNDPATYWKLDDTILKKIEVSDAPELAASRKIIERLRKRDLYRYCASYVKPKDCPRKSEKVTPAHIAAISKGALLPDDIAVANVKINYALGDKNPVDNVHFFDRFDSTEKYLMLKHKVSHLLPEVFEEHIVKVYAKDPAKADKVREAFEEYQRHSYDGAVHSTPAKPKKRHRSRSPTEPKKLIL
ncbi:hypothetical protein KFL_003380010 [Klebsormidium nitens]|uniref:HD/PDEase domain-containing protein n=1 Tax=Klebsormidium nitens TaxID=105231 RepID=A0A1Y1IEN8_KLENI|nr:hypothetical protein KFL_003380010 [Klebsormidium nitens]|eukprot:GAQ87196.1 hypothetical protein KFL_003380010 [Klebsormidium nitens]